MSEGYQLIRSKRKTLAIHVKPDGRVEVRAPLQTPQRSIDSFIKEKEEWIRKTQKKMEEREEQRREIRLDPFQVNHAKKQARDYLIRRCRYFAPRMGVDYNRVRINSAKGRWGSCSASGSLNFTYRLIFAEPDLIDYVVVHELAHRREMNHSHRFWAIVEKELPDYRTRREKLREFQRQIAIVEKGD